MLKGGAGYFVDMLKESLRSWQSAEKARVIRFQYVQIGI